jgi:hypothetical protein
VETKKINRRGGDMVIKERLAMELGEVVGEMFDPEEKQALARDREKIRWMEDIREFRKARGLV